MRPYDVTMPYSVTVSIAPALAHRNRLTTAFRLILAIPHIFLVGGIGLSYVYDPGHGDTTSWGGETGLLGAVAGLLAVVSWFMIVFTGKQSGSIRQFTQFYLRWRVRALAYLMLLEDRYPPFGDEPYPARVVVVDPTAPRDRLTVAFRILLAIPHFIVLVLLAIAWWVTTMVAWVLILFTAAYPQGLYTFGAGCLAWLIRVEAYVLLLVDEYPPFSFDNIGPDEQTQPGTLEDTK
jgi:hypothetical protein